MKRENAVPSRFTLHEIGMHIIFAGSNGEGGPGRALLFYLLYLYRMGFVRGQMGYASALAWVLVLIAAATILLVFRLERRLVFYELADEQA